MPARATNPVARARARGIHFRMVSTPRSRTLSPLRGAGRRGRHASVSGPAAPGGRRARAFVALALVLAIGWAGTRTLASPLPPIRPAGGVLTPLAPSVSSASPIDRACGTDVDGLPARYTEAAVRRATLALTPLPTPHSTDVGEIAVLEDDGTFFFPDDQGNPNLDVASVARAFYRMHGDDYDQLVVWLSSGLTNWLGSPTSLAANWQTRNPVSGLGLDVVDYNTALGLPPRVQCVLTMNGLQKYPASLTQEVPGLPNYVTEDVLAHEFGHEWLAYCLVQTPQGPGFDLLGRAHQHWSFFFDADGSVMEGPDWVRQGPDTFSSLPPIARYGPLDQYLMGVRAAGELDSLIVLSDTATFTPPDPRGPYVPFSDPNANLTVHGPYDEYAIGDVVTANGPRVPDAAHSPHALRVAFALVVPRGSNASAGDLSKVDGIRAAFPDTVQSYTGGRLAVDATLDSRAGTLRLDHVPLGDIESSASPRLVRLHVNVDPGGIPTHVDPTGTTVSWRVLPDTDWTAVTMFPAGGDSFSTSLPATAGGQTLQYRFHAKGDQPGVQADLPGPTQLPFAYVTGPDHTPPVITQWPLPTQALERMPQTLLARVRDNLGPAGLDAVWCEVSVDGGAVQTVPATSAGGDSFTVAVGAGAVRGSAIAYRFAARDKAAAANVGYSNASFDTLRVGWDSVDDFWGPAPWTHASVLTNHRDEWHPVDLDAFPSGSGAWHCGLDGLPYDPYLDAVLTGPLVSGITAGCSLTFEHHFDLELASIPGEPLANDGARVEIQVGATGTWNVAFPDSAYPYTLFDMPGGPCWSGTRNDWHQERIDLSPYAPGPVRVRFRMSSDLFVGGGGWWIDQVRFHFPQQPTAGAGPNEVTLALGACWPNPASGELRQALRLPRAAVVEWALYDLAGRRVAVLHQGALAPGARELTAALPRAIAGGLYFSRVRVDGRALGARRVAIVR